MTPWSEPCEIQFSYARISLETVRQQIGVVLSSEVCDSLLDDTEKLILLFFSSGNAVCMYKYKLGVIPDIESYTKNVKSQT